MTVSFKVIARDRYNCISECKKNIPNNVKLIEYTDIFNVP